MKFFATLLAGTAFAVSAFTASADVRFGIMNEAYPPFFAKDASGKWQGWEIDLMDAVCAEMKEKCSIVELSWDGLIPALQTKKFDVIWSSMSNTEERQKIIDFTDKYYNTPSKLIGAKGEKAGATAEDVKGKTIGIQVATIQSEYYKKYFAGVADEKTYQTLDEAFQDLAAGRIDYVFGDSIVLDAFVKSDAGKDCCADMGDVADDKEILGLGVSGGLRKEDTELKAKLNAAIAAVRASGKYDEISKKYFSFNIYGQ
ncbi:MULTISPECIES: transporter substrate-binding domain-containing protein [Agrobacterium tumefaciens complex]|jgi:polar amino acid transport system substrate-binding protein|uniref:transporter substrate-binding domain-containing protein n=1 Tax=Agrobacterium tumefaciens complex TaxID=1183400 RepID=UPI000DD742F8|nr:MULTISPECIES: transporter substrate-binding domain-containing protein [Agrobacterium tumefaciens complex]MBB4406617.1 polar amino acid transport system substrate-binding protein [Agrobacterium radiobacter]MBB4449974.1 polar amino acid transport system substrate-binding protein [Agrobacterium radiobacter]MDR6589889.1 polar amino acid transport system substrate-binding protein [Agrobacterium tumefaciens]UXT97751.1 transporter substrate-binding domain-containing protein [Agrobacterium tumefacie